mgnify:CR=1 FL=1
MLEFTFDGVLWIYEGKAKIHFVTVPDDISGSIKAFVAGPRRGWGAVKVSVQIGQTRWRTSIFPIDKGKSFILPIKAEVRKAEELEEGSCPTVFLSVEPDLV